jgi:hypothetical protein
MRNISLPSYKGVIRMVKLGDENNIQNFICLSRPRHTWQFTFHMNLKEIFIHLLRQAGRSPHVAISGLNWFFCAVSECKLCCPEILLVTVVLFTL